MSWKEMSIRIADASDDFIKSFRALPTIEGDRDITSYRSKKRVARLQSKLRAGEFWSPTWATAHCVEGGTDYRIDGQASSYVMSEANGLLPPDFQVFIRDFLCDTYDDVVKCFTNIDCPLSARRAPEQIKAILKSLKFATDVPPSYARKAIYSILFFEGGCKGRILSDDQRNAMLPKHEQYLVWSEPLIRNKWISSSCPTLAACYATYLASPRQAKDFWLHVIHEDGVSKDCPTRTLAEFLKTRLLDPVANRRWDKRAVYVKCILAWNAHVRGAATSLAYFEGAKALPEVVVRREGRVVKADMSAMRVGA